jgi:hypothetical protein
MLAEIEPALRRCLRNADLVTAKRLVTEIQPVLRATGHATRLLQIKNWLFTCALEARELDFATSGFEGNRKLAGRGTRIFLEATASLGICYLRLGDIQKAKVHVREAIECVNNIQSDRRREQFHKRYLARLEEEIVLFGVVGSTTSEIDVAALQEGAVQLLPKSEDELFEMMGQNLPGHSVQLLLDVQEFYRKALPIPDRKALPCPTTSDRTREIGRKVGSAFKHVAWRSICDPDSDLYKAWSNNLEYVYNKRLLAGALAAAFKSWKITCFALIVAITAYVIKFGATVFCKAFAPESLMIHVTDRG